MRRARGSHVLVAQLPVNNRPETGRARRRSFPTAAGWFFARIRHASSLGSFRQNARSLALMLRSIAARQECIFFHCRTALRCVSKHEGKGIARLILRDGASRLLRMRLPKHRRERRAGWSGPCFFLLFCRLGTVPGCGGPGSAMYHSLSLASHPGHATASDALVPYSPFQTALLVPAARFFAPGLCPLLRSPEMRGGRSAEKRSGAALAHPLGVHVTRHARRLARRLASHNAGRSPLGAPPWRFWAPGPRFSHRHWRRIGHSELLAARS
jgi:hypothetical protein